ncbi:carbohydrate-binding module family 5 protein [Cylindrobasidium torrendii FP15055 ss-10]|uniref:chitinase n=1 Tax=Cylindrobasidium torrendii FP15055 ss-10 TaxID=1314674 RepID=A0A0D7BAM0_9AGAR|nr:carbohydrate-binding module family 5 protein [Cylindrobasidium torrendii FP15055 ss-10]
MSFAFDNSRYDNVGIITMLYWGQNSYGAVNGNDSANFQKTLAYYCQDDVMDVIPVSFVNVFFGTGGAPSMNLANTCNPTDNATFPGTNLPDCSALASDVKSCQAKGKLVTLSLGGATGSVGFESDQQGIEFANTIWNDFLGGSSDTRPLGDAVLDGVDLDIEGGTSTGYAAFVNTIRSLSSGAGKEYYITAAPQCVYPDAALSGVLNAAKFDAVYVLVSQFYNNPCGLTHYGDASNWNFGLWDNWARNVSINPDVKIYIGAPASSTAAGSGYVDLNTLSSIAVDMRKSFPSFGGVMLWDASQAYFNSRYDRGIKDALVAAGGTGFEFPACSAERYTSGGSYTGGSTVSYSGYIWKAKWWTSSEPRNNANGDWSAISACQDNGSTQPSSTTTSGGSTPTGSTCDGVAAWVASTAYVGGQSVIYNSHIWTAKWWTQGNTPGGSDGVWTDGGAC